jgi:hypothetical protein
MDGHNLRCQAARVAGARDSLMNAGIDRDAAAARSIRPVARDATRAAP